MGKKWLFWTILYNFSPFGWTLFQKTGNFKILVKVLVASVSCVHVLYSFYCHSKLLKIRQIAVQASCMNQINAACTWCFVVYLLTDKSCQGLTHRNFKKIKDARCSSMHSRYLWTIVMVLHTFNVWAWFYLVSSYCLHTSQFLFEVQSKRCVSLCLRNILTRKMTLLNWFTLTLSWHKWTMFTVIL